MPKNGLHPQKKKKKKTHVGKLKKIWIHLLINSQPDWGASGKKDLILTDFKLNSS